MKNFGPGELVRAEEINANFSELYTEQTVTLPVFDGAWRHDPGGGVARTVNGTTHLSISLVRTGSSFHMGPGGIIDVMRVNNLVRVPSTREWVICGTLFGPGIWPMPIFLNNGLVRVLCYGDVDIQNNGAYRGYATWTVGQQ